MSSTQKEIQLVALHPERLALGELLEQAEERILLLARAGARAAVVLARVPGARRYGWRLCVAAFVAVPWCWAREGMGW